MQRLGQLSFQIQKRERAAQVENEYQYEAAHRQELRRYEAFQWQTDDSMASYLRTPESGGQMVPGTVEWQQQYDEFGWKQEKLEVPADDHQAEDESWTDTCTDFFLESAVAKPVKPVFVRRTASMNDADLDTGCGAYEPERKRYSLPTLPGLPNIWGPTDDERDADVEEDEQ